MTVEKIEYTGAVNEHGELKIVHRSYLNNDLKEFFAGSNVDIIIKKRRAKRSLNQNAFLHVLFTIFSKSLVELTGEKSLTRERVKDMCKLKFLKVDVVNTETGEVLGEEIRHTSDLNKEDMAVFIEDIYRYAAEQFNIVLPQADTQQRFL